MPTRHRYSPIFYKQPAPSCTGDTSSVATRKETGVIGAINSASALHIGEVGHCPVREGMEVDVDAAVRTQQASSLMDGLWVQPHPLMAVFHLTLFT